MQHLKTWKKPSLILTVGASLFMANLAARAEDPIRIFNTDRVHEAIPDNNPNLNNVVNDGFLQSTQRSDFLVTLYGSCFGTNLRSVANPLAPNSTVRMTVVATKDDGSDAKFSVTFPAAAVLKEGVEGAEAIPRGLPTSLVPTSPELDAPEGSTASLSGNVLRVTLKNFTHRTITVDAGGNINIEDLRSLIKSVSFEQRGGTGGAYMGHDGPLSSKLDVRVNARGTAVEIWASFPGQEGFCGGYHSPLMLFFDKKNPSFTGKSDILSTKGADLYWVEKNHPGYFLALDAKSDRAINSKDQLFGYNQGDEAGNGFEALRKLDSNGDGKIDATDKDFDKLVLWQDKNSNGKSDPGEVKTLTEMNVESISLNFNKKNLEPIGNRAQFREASTFTFKNKAGKSATGRVIDVWFTRYIGK